MTRTDRERFDASTRLYVDPNKAKRAARRMRKLQVKRERMSR